MSSLSFFKRQFIQDIQNGEGIKYINPEWIDENKESLKYWLQNQCWNLEEIS